MAEEVLPDYYCYRANAKPFWPDGVFERLQEYEGSLMETKGEMVLAFGCVESDAGLPDPLTPNLYKENMGSVTFVRANAVNEED